MPFGVKTHGQSHTRFYRIWCKMRSRCLNPTAKDYAKYGGRGIKVCERWKDFAVFAADVGEPPSRTHTIGRINDDKDFTPDNVFWAPKGELIRRSRKAQLEKKNNGVVV